MKNSIYTLLLLTIFLSSCSSGEPENDKTSLEKSENEEPIEDKSKEIEVDKIQKRFSSIHAPKVSLNLARSSHHKAL